MSMLIVENTNRHSGKVLSHFEDDYGNKLSDLHMCEDVVIVFTDGSKILLSQDWRGQECYISQRSKESEQ